MKYKLIIFDMDGVIFQHKNFWLELHKALGTYEEGMMLTKKYLHADYEQLVKEVAGRLWKGKDAKPYFDLIEESTYLPPVQEVLQALKAKGYQTGIITSGPKHLAQKAVQENNMDYYHAQELIIGSDNRFTGEVIHADIHDKTTELKAFAQKAGCTLAETVFVGHDHNDVTALGAAGFGVAYNPENDEVEKAADKIISDLNELLLLLS